MNWLGSDYGCMHLTSSDTPTSAYEIIGPFVEIGGRLSESCNVVLTFTKVFDAGKSPKLDGSQSQRAQTNSRQQPLNRCGRR
jgi:hypothetical protein